MGFFDGDGGQDAGRKGGGGEAQDSGKGQGAGPKGDGGRGQGAGRKGDGGKPWPWERRAPRNVRADAFHESRSFPPLPEEGSDSEKVT